jgi:hypothetical protein
MHAHPGDLDNPQTDAHLVQLYGSDDGALIGNVVRYLFDGLTSGCGLLVVATQGHRVAFLRGLARVGADVDREMNRGRLVFLNASDTLGRLMVDGYPDAARFENNVGSALREATARAESGCARAYGEMVGVLWQAGQYPSAIRLEQLWNRLRATVPFSLYCSYPIGIFDRQFEMGVLDALMCAHTHLVPAHANVNLEKALSRAMDEVLGVAAAEVKPQASRVPRADWAKVPSPEAMILWLRSNLPEKAEAVLARARQYYPAPA